MQPKPSSFTAKASGIVSILITPIEVLTPDRVDQKFHGQALWDTGAARTVISMRVIEILNLMPKKTVKVLLGDGSLSRRISYDINLRLPNGLTISGISAIDAESFGDGFDILIGMDVITLGDFSITNFEGKTCMSFRYPSLHEIDYVKNFDLVIKSK